MPCPDRRLGLPPLRGLPSPVPGRESGDFSQQLGRRTAGRVADRPDHGAKDSTRSITLQNAETTSMGFQRVGPNSEPTSAEVELSSAGFGAGPARATRSIRSDGRADRRRHSAIGHANGTARFLRRPFRIRLGSIDPGRAFRRSADGHHPSAVTRLTLRASEPRRIVGLPFPFCCSNRSGPLY